MQDTLRITEVFYSLQGETRTAGLPTVFVRLTGCPLRCQYCDSAYAFSGGTVRTLDDILEQVASYRPRYVCVTGGEPLAQPNAIPLLKQLCDAGYEVSLETSGALDISAVDSRVSRVVDLKTPDSKEAHRNRYENIDLLTANDQVKFVICSRDDYDWATSKLIQYGLERRAGEVALGARVVAQPAPEALQFPRTRMGVEDHEGRDQEDQPDMRRYEVVESGEAHLLVGVVPDHQLPRGDRRDFPAGQEGGDFLSRIDQQEGEGGQVEPGEMHAEVAWTVDVLAQVADGVDAAEQGHRQRPGEEEGA